MNLTSLRLLVLGLCAAATAHAEINLTPSYLSFDMVIPGNRQNIIGLEFGPAGWTASEEGRLFMTTEIETWISNSNGTATFIKIFDPIIAGARLNPGSRSAYDPVSKLFLFTGGTFDVRLYGYSPHTGSIVSEEALLDLMDQPRGLAVRSGTNDVFVSFPSVSVPGHGDLAPALRRYTRGAGDQFGGTLFGNSGPGAVSEQVGAMVIGPDGRLNVLDTGLQKILRYDTETLEFIDAISLVNTTTDGNSFAISSTGYIFTANINSTSGVIYDYITGEYVGTFTDPAHPPDDSLGRLVMTADDVGNVYVSNIKVNEHLSVFSTAAIIPEPAHYGLASGLFAGLALFRRRRQRT